MMSWNPTRLLTLVATLALVTACGAQPSTRLAGSGLADFETEAAKGPIATAFNDTYLETIALNEPRARKDPNNTDKALFRLIKGAKTSLDGAFYDIEDPGVVKALVAAKGRGVNVRLITDSDNVVDKVDPSKPRAATEALKAAGIPVVEDHRSGIMHHKFLVVDGQVVWTGSTNLTPTSLYRHNNNAMTLQSPKVAKVYATEFERLFTLKEFGKAARGESLPPAPITVGSAQVSIFFSPAGGGRAAVVETLKQAKSRIRFLTFSLTDPETGAVIAMKAAQGVKVGGIFDRWLAAGQYSLFNQFKAAGYDVRKDGNEALMHHKVIIVDNDTLITGSYNYSQNAEDNNNEGFMIIRNAPVVVNAFAREYDRLVYASKHNRPPAHKAPDAEKKTGDVK